MKANVRILGLVAVLALAGTSARADYSYSFAVDQSSITLLPGETTTVNVYLVETVSNGDAPRLTDPADGLLSAGVRLDFGVGAPVQVLAVGDITAGPDFTSPFNIADLPGDGTAGLYEFVDFGAAPALGTVISPTSSRVLLGSFLLTGVSIGSAFDIKVMDFTPDLVETITAQGISLDDPTTNIAAARIHVTGSRAVPEPASVALLLLGAGGLWAYRRRQSKVA